MFAILITIFAMAFFNSLLKNKGGAPVELFEKPQTPEEQKIVNAEFDHSLRYFIIFIVFGGSVAIWISFLLTALHTLPTPAGLVNVGLASILLMMAILFQTILIQSPQLNFILIIIEALALLAFFYSTFSAWFLLGSVAFVITWAIGFARARAALSEMLRISFWNYGTLMITTTITAFALFLSCFYVGLYQQQGGITFTAYKFVVSGAAPGLQYVAPNFNPETKVNSFLDGTIRDYFADQDNFNSLPETIKDSTVQQATTGAQARIVEFTKQILKPGDTIASYTFRWVSGGIKTLQERGLGAFVVIGIFLLIYFAIKGLMFFIKWPVLLFSFMLYLLLQAVGIVSLSSETRQKEIIIVK